MNYSEKILKKYLLFTLDEPFTLYDIAWDIIVDLDKLKFSKKEIKNKVLEIIKFFINSQLFYIGDLNEVFLCVKWDLKLDQIIEKIEPLIDTELNAEDLWVIYFDLTPKGKEEAKRYCEKTIKLREEIIKSAQAVIDLNFIINLAKKEFETIDSDEIIKESVSAVDWLFETNFVKVGYKKEWHFETIKYDATEFPKFLKSELLNLISGLEVHEKLLIQNEQPTNALVEKWKEYGGRLVNEWYELIDRN